MRISHTTPHIVHPSHQLSYRHAGKIHYFKMIKNKYIGAIFPLDSIQFNVKVHCSNFHCIGYLLYEFCGCNSVKELIVGNSAASSSLIGAFPGRITMATDNPASRAGLASVNKK